jgi:hypothetical protein
MVGDIYAASKQLPVSQGIHAALGLDQCYEGPQGHDWRLVHGGGSSDAGQPSSRQPPQVAALNGARARRLKPKENEA